MTIKERNARLIDMEDLSSLDMLKEHVIYSDEYAALDKPRQLEMFKFCRMHANYPACIENLTQMRYAIAHCYFGEGYI